MGAAGNELKAMLKARKLLISLNAKNAKGSLFGQLRYTRVLGLSGSLTAGGPVMFGDAR